MSILWHTDPHMTQRHIWRAILISLIILFTAFSLNLFIKKKPCLTKPLVIAISSMPESLDPRFHFSAIALYMSHLVYAPLFIYDDDLNIKPFLAESYQILSSTRYRITLRPNLYFHDGAPIRAKDIVETLLLFISKESGSLKADKFDHIKRIYPTGDLSLEIILQKPKANFIEDLYGIGMFSAAHPHIGTGPFRLIAIDNAQELIELEAFDKWFSGAPFIKQVIAKVIHDNTTRLLELMHGNVDLSSGDISAMQLSTLKDYPFLRIETLPGLGYTYLAMNLRAPQADLSPKAHLTRQALANPLVRRAIAESIDIESIIRYKLKGLAVRATGLIPPRSWAKSAAILPTQYNPEHAQKLLEEAGFPLQAHLGNTRFNLTLSASTDRFRQSIALALADYLRAVGIGVSLHIGDWNSIFADIQKGNFDLFSAIWTPIIDPSIYEWIFHSKNIPTPIRPGGNRVAYQNTQVDKWIEIAQESQNPALRKQLYQQIETQIAHDLPYIPLWFEDRIVITNQRLIGFKPARTGSLLSLAQAHLKDQDTTCHPSM